MFLWFGAQPDDRESDDAEQYSEGDEVLQEAQNLPPTDDRDMELGVEKHPVRLDVDRDEDEEAPHGEEVGQPRDRPAQHASLCEHLFDLGANTLAHVVGAALFL